jgi:ubiquitin-conjugating enzyme E2 M
MLRLFHHDKKSVQGKKRRDSSVQDKKVPVESKKLPTACEIRIQKDLSELDLPSNIIVAFPNPDDLLLFHIAIKPEEGFYKDGQFWFCFKIRETYPYDPPKVTCMQKIYHPNIDITGGVCLNILREDWKPVLSLSAIIYGLQHLFLEPNSEDPLNKEAAQTLATNHIQFQQNTKRSMKGDTIQGQKYDNVLIFRSNAPIIASNTRPKLSTP